jgi:hypothetical protein
VESGKPDTDFGVNFIRFAFGIRKLNLRTNRKKFTPKSEFRKMQNALAVPSSPEFPVALEVRAKARKIVLHFPELAAVVPANSIKHRKI